MFWRSGIAPWFGLGGLGLGTLGCQPTKQETSSPGTPRELAPATMPGIGSIDDRFQSYSIEMLEVTDGKFWKPCGSGVKPADQRDRPVAASDAGDTLTGMGPGAYAYRPPIDLANARRRKLAAVLAGRPLAKTRKPTGATSRCFTRSPRRVGSTSHVPTDRMFIPTSKRGTSDDN